MLNRIIVAVLIGIVVWLICVFGGALLVSLGIPVLKTLGLAFFTGWTPFSIGPRA